MILKVFLLLLASGLGSSQYQSFIREETNKTLYEDAIYFPSSVPGYFQQPIILVPNPHANIDQLVAEKHQQPQYQQPQDRVDEATPTPQELLEATKPNVFKKPSSQFSGNGNSFQPQRPTDDRQEYTSLSAQGRPPNNNRGSSENQQPFRPSSYNNQQPPVRRPTNGNDRIDNSQVRPNNQFPTPNYQPTQSFNNRRPSINANENSQIRPSTASQEFTQRPSRPGFNRPQRPTSQNNYNQNSYESQEQKPEDYKPITKFAWQCFKASNTPPSQNLVMCPLSPQLLLGHLAAGSEGQTQNEIVNAITYKSPRLIEQCMRSILNEGGHRELQFATAFFIADDVTLHHQFRSNNEVEVIPTDFKHPQKFQNVYNKWAHAKTKGNLPQIQANPNPSTRMILSSAVYFRTPWVYKFNPAHPGTFYTFEGRASSVPMMTLRKKLPYGSINDMADWCSIPYNSSDSMILIKARDNINIEQVMNAMQPETIDEIMDSLYRDNYANVNLTMPKFKADSTTNLIKPLQKMGINRAASQYSEITKLSTNEPLQISNAVQQASMEVNEEGSIASSLTSFSVVALSFAPPTPNVEFMVDKPFLALIVNRERKFPYFIAKICTP